MRQSSFSIACLLFAAIVEGFAPSQRLAPPPAVPPLRSTSSFSSCSSSSPPRTAEVWTAAHEDPSIGRLLGVKILPENWSDESCDLFLDEVTGFIKAEAEAGNYYVGWYDVRDLQPPRNPRVAFCRARQLVAGIGKVTDEIDGHIHSCAVLANPPRSLVARLTRNLVEFVIRISDSPMAPVIFDSNDEALVFLHGRCQEFQNGGLHLAPPPAEENGAADDSRQLFDVEVAAVDNAPATSTFALSRLYRMLANHPSRRRMKRTFIQQQGEAERSAALKEA